MKLFVPSSSPSSTSFDTDIYSHRSGGSSAGCVFGVLRRLLCSSSLPTHPSLNIETCSVEERSACENMMKNYEQKQVVDASPGIVARLMGLDSLPERITKSRSLNSMDQMMKEKDESPKLHRRVKTSVSFREMPTYMELEDDDFIVLRFDKGRGDKDSRSRRTRSRTSIEDLKQSGAERHRTRRVKTSSAAEDEERKQGKPCQAQSSDGATANKLSRTVKYNYVDESPDDNECKRKKRSWSVNKKVAGAQSDSEESSPVSIFDFHTDQETETPTSDDDSWNRSSSSSMVSSPEPDNSNISTEKKTEAVECRQHALLNKTVAVVVNGQKNSEMWGRISKVTVAEIIAADWGDKDVQDLAAEFEVQIMDQLMNELVHFDILGSRTS